MRAMYCERKPIHSVVPSIASVVTWFSGIESWLSPWRNTRYWLPSKRFRPPPVAIQMKPSGSCTIAFGVFCDSPYSVPTGWKVYWRICAWALAMTSPKTTSSATRSGHRLDRRCTGGIGSGRSKRRM